MCTELAALALWANCHASTTLFPALANLRLSQLSIEISQLRRMPITGDWVHLKRLDLVLFSDPQVDDLVAALQRVPELTHLALQLLLSGVIETLIGAIFRDACPTLRVLVLLRSKHDHFPENSDRFGFDDRVVVLPDQDDDEIVPEWLAKVDGEKNIWTKAEAIIAERRIVGQGASLSIRDS